MQPTDIKTFEDACQALGYDAAKVIPDFSGYPVKHQAAMIAHSKLIIITEALNDGQPIDLNGAHYEIVLDKTEGFSFSLVSICLWACRAGSRLCFRSSEVAEYAAEQFIELYKEYNVQAA